MVELQIKSRVTIDGETLTIPDITGAYSSLQTGGWGTPNFDISTAVTAIIKIAKRNADGTFSTDTSVDVIADLPSDAGDEVQISAVDAGQGSVFADGIYRITYVVTGSSSGTPYTLSVVQYKAFTPVIDTCLLDKASKVSACDCACDSLDDKFRCVSDFYRLLCGAKCCGDLDGIQKYIDILTSLCDSDCGCN